MIGMVRAMALDSRTGERNGRVNAIAPLQREPNLARGNRRPGAGPGGGHAHAPRHARHPARRPAEEIGEAAAYLASYAASSYRAVSDGWMGLYGA